MKYGRVSVLASILCDSRELAIIERVPPEAFDPAPRVDSAVVALTPCRDGARHQGRFISVRALDQILRCLLDGVRGPARGVGLEDALEAKEEELTLPRGWRSAVARAGLTNRPPWTLEPQEFVALTGELE